MCVQNGALDYVVALHETSNDLRVLRFEYDIARETAFIRDYKSVDKEADLPLSGDVYVDCKFDGKFRGENTYVAGILGSYLHQNSIISYYFAKFSTKYNLTEYFIKSEDDKIMEIPRAVRVDLDN